MNENVFVRLMEANLVFMNEGYIKDNLVTLMLYACFLSVLREFKKGVSCICNTL